MPLETETLNLTSSSDIAPSPEPQNPIPSAPKEQANVTQNKSPLRQPDTRSSDEIRRQIESAGRAGAPAEHAKAPAESQSQKNDEHASKGTQEGLTPTEDRSKWFDPDKGFKTAEDMKRSYGELQTKLTRQSEEVKQERTRLELEQSQIKQEVERMKKLQDERPLTAEEKQKQEAVKKWEQDNKEALDLIKETIRRDLGINQQEQRVQELNQQAEQGILKERNEWLEAFNKDDGRKKLWPVMEQIFKDKGDTAEAAVKDFMRNPLPYIEAMAIQKDFSNIAERIKADAVEQYKKTVKETAEVERKTKFALPGGPKSSSDVDATKLSSAEIGSLLSRNENG